jgi:hypothetical protein
VRLEDRSVPAGNVTASVSGGVLFVVGDDLPNQVSVAGTGSWGAIVRPLGDTTLNGGTDPLQFRDLKRGYDVKVFGGDDLVIVNGVTARRGLRVELGDGDDDLFLENTTSRRETDIFGGDGEDTFTITGSDLRRRVAIDQGGGDDRLTTAGTKYGKNTFFSGQDGRNVLTVGDGVQFRRPPQVTGFSDAAPPDDTPPEAVDDEAEVTANGAVTVDVLANDSPGAGTLDPSSVTITLQPNFGTVAVNADGTVTYTSTSAAGDLDSFAYTVRNSLGVVSNGALVTVAVNDPTVPPSPPPPPDTTAPSVALETTATDAAVGTPIPFTARFDESVTGFDQSDVAVTNGTVTNFVAVTAAEYRFTVTPAAEVPTRVTVAAGAARDAAGNVSTAAAPVILPSLSDPNWRAVGTQGLRAWDARPGTGTAITSTGQTITVRYTGWLADTGAVFDTTGVAGNPATFPLGNLIQGWQQGLIGMQVGGIRRLDIPSPLGYGPTGSPPTIPGNARLVFQIELLAVS